MPTYVYRCPRGHVTELVNGMTDPRPDDLLCAAEGDVDAGASRTICGQRAPRVFLPPAAIIFNGQGTYTNDYRLKYDRKRRPNAGDDLPLPIEAAITRAEGAEYDPPKHVPGGVVPGLARRL